MTTRLSAYPAGLLPRAVESRLLAMGIPLPWFNADDELEEDPVIPQDLVVPEPPEPDVGDDQAA